MNNTMVITAVTAVLFIAYKYIGQLLIRFFRSRLSLLLSRLLAIGVATGLLAFVLILINAVGFPIENRGYTIGIIAGGVISEYLEIRFE